ncbi:MAG: 50S ribosomal protein L15 [Thaumarchaeota archaeon 13_1_40CM_38_12]|nr:MAG: 50S ribosomal protein L15 [Thaumarchaeota archaeon 13_1_40CM_38_12]OLC36902.1 MAG: 50S ribosomal protein L15 [Thaumarchaeota archaeon 13_1_40CM_4_38_7]OLC93502.1 MAG: 50S ribosomal protein L15 [Thaumarchaeota archaeon 13_1_40CM_3_38_6]OLD40643.1 MAG: 50S ribosomal protein L15 [Thaumarchaeota archaeon 13_1_40CM_2_39_4]TLY04397.1 MAG: 50S ribosomal protein L15e [Nitrososphaerota archaeon]
MTSYQDQVWLRMWKENAPELRAKAVEWRRQNALVRVERPSRIQKARQLGYKAKQGIVVIRMRVGRGNMRKKRPVAGRRPKHLGVLRIKPALSMQRVAERRVLERHPNMQLLGSYYLYQDGLYLWYEVILADPSHPRIVKDKEIRGKLSGLKN